MNCLDCKKSIWIGQSPDVLYTSELHTMEGLRQFLFEHRGHKLMFEDLDRVPGSYSGWTEIDTDTFKKDA